MNKRVGIFMGSFNPFHMGHFAVIMNVLNNGWVDEVVVLPAQSNPWKNVAPVSLEAREVLIKLFMTSFIETDLCNEIVEIIETEPDEDGKFYSYQQLYVFLERRKSIGEKADYFILAGTDVYDDLISKKWKNSDWILENFGLIKSDRGGEPGINVSSTWIREQIKNKILPYPYLTSSQMIYIRRNKLYED